MCAGLRMYYNATVTLILWTLTKPSSPPLTCSTLQRLDDGSLLFYHSWLWQSRWTRGNIMAEMLQLDVVKSLEADDWSKNTCWSLLGCSLGRRAPGWHKESGAHGAEWPPFVALLPPRPACPDASLAALSLTAFSITSESSQLILIAICSAVVIIFMTVVGYILVSRLVAACALTRHWPQPTLCCHSTPNTLGALNYHS